jgi:hypothetical protein
MVTVVVVCWFWFCWFWFCPVVEVDVEAVEGVVVTVKVVVPCATAVTVVPFTVAIDVEELVIELTVLPSLVTIPKVGDDANDMVSLAAVPGVIVSVWLGVFAELLS